MSRPSRSRTRRALMTVRPTIRWVARREAKDVSFRCFLAFAWLRLTDVDVEDVAVGVIVGVVELERADGAPSRAHRARARPRPKDPARRAPWPRRPAGRDPLARQLRRESSG